MSRQIRDLEDELGVLLFERTGKAVSLTDAGRLFLKEARAVLGANRRSSGQVRAFRASAVKRNCTLAIRRYLGTDRVAGVARVSTGNA